MAFIVIGGVSHHIPPFRLRELRAAAPYIDRVLGQRRSLSLAPGETADEAAERMVEGEGIMQSLTNTLGDTLSVIAVGILLGRGDKKYTPEKIADVADEIEGQLALDEISLLNPVFNDILREAGMMKTRPMKPREEMSSSPSASVLTDSSLSSSQPVAPAETGTE
jgi:hypothetical protein